MSEEPEINDFASLMEATKDVVKLKREANANHRVQFSQNITLDKSKTRQRQAALGKVADDMGLERLMPEQHAANDIIEFKQAGIQESNYKKLRTGRYEIEARLDLHGLTVNQALEAVKVFITRSVHKHKRCVHISHGKGITQAEPARLKNHLAIWLKHMPEVMAYHSAMPQDGGTGCVYVLLKKRERLAQ